MQAKTELHRQDSVDRTEENESHLYEQIDTIDQEHAHTTEGAISSEHTNTEAVGNEDVYPDAAVMTSPNQAYGCPIKKVDEGHTYKNVNLVEATTLFYTTSDGKRTYRPPEPEPEAITAAISDPVADSTVSPIVPSTTSDGTLV